MKNKEIQRRVCPWLSGIYKSNTNCLGARCAWITLIKRFDTSNGIDPENPLRGIFNLEELPKKDWEYECGLVRHLPETQSM